MSNLRPDIISTDKASKHPLKHGRFYTARVVNVSSAGLIKIYIDELQSYFGPLVPLNMTETNKASAGDYVKCTFSDEFFREVIVFGFSQKKEDVFASKENLDVLSNPFYDQHILSSIVFG